MFIRQIPYILALEEERKISAAARRLGVSQSTVSKFLRRLEEEVGCSLFVNARDQLELTPQGRVYVEAAKKIDAIYQEMAASISNIPEAHTGLISGGTRGPGEEGSL